MVTGGPGEIVQKRAGRALQKRANKCKIVQNNPGGSLQERAKTGGKVQNNFADSGVLKNVFFSFSTRFAAECDEYRLKRTRFKPFGEQIRFFISVTIYRIPFVFHLYTPNLLHKNFTHNNFASPWGSAKKIDPGNGPRDLDFRILLAVGFRTRWLLTRTDVK